MHLIAIYALGIQIIYAQVLPNFTTISSSVVPFSPTTTVIVPFSPTTTVIVPFSPTTTVIVRTTSALLIASINPTSIMSSTDTDISTASINQSNTNQTPKIDKLDKYASDSQVGLSSVAIGAISVFAVAIVGAGIGIWVFRKRKVKNSTVPNRNSSNREYDNAVRNIQFVTEADATKSEY